MLESDNKRRTVCDITEKLYLAHRRLVFYTKDVDLAKEFDRMLWMWKQSSFIPHLYSEKLSNSYDEPVVITSHVEKVEGYDSLLLYDPLSLDTLLQFEMVVDFAEKYNQTNLAKSRERYREYQKNKWSTESLPPGQFLQMSLA